MDSDSHNSKEINIKKPHSLKNQPEHKDKSVGIPSFISKTYQILEKEELSHIILWGETGNNFYIKNIKDFEENILPVYFRHKNFASFVRQLNMYDFHKIRGEQKHIFEHKLFKKGASHLLQHIKRKCFKKGKEDGDENNEDVFQGQEIKQKKIPFNMPSIQNIQKEHIDDINRRKLSIEKEWEKQKLYQMISEERSKNRIKNMELMEQIMSDLKEVCPQSEQQIKQQINIIKSNPRYRSLHGKYYMYQIYRKLKQSLYQLRPRNTVEDLDQLSIEEQILYTQIQKPAGVQITSLTNFQTENFMKSSYQTIRQICGQEFFSKQMF